MMQTKDRRRAVDIILRHHPEIFMSEAMAMEHVAGSNTRIRQRLEKRNNLMWNKKKEKRKNPIRNKAASIEESKKKSK